MVWKMIYFVASDLHVHLPDVYCHWDSHSQYYAGGDALVAALIAGWSLGEMVYYEHHWLDCGTRYINIYHFELRRGNSHRIMPVIGNPFVEQLLSCASLRVLPIEQIIHH